MIQDYINEALKIAKYEIIEDDEPYYAQVDQLKGVWASGKSFEECRNNLIEVIEGWLIIRFQRGLEIPEINGVTIKKPQELSIK